MISIPLIATVADLQRSYRKLVNKIKKSGEPLLVVNKGKPDVVVLDTNVYEVYIERLKRLEERYLLEIFQKGLNEYKSGKTVRLGKKQRLIDLIS